MENRAKTGIRAKVGVLIPASDVVVEHDFQRFLPSDISFHVARLRQGRAALLGDQENLFTMIASSEDAAKSLTVADIDLLLFCCTSASFFKGHGWDKELAGRLQAATNIPSITTTTAIIDALKDAGHKKIFLATPYPDFCNQVEIEVLTKAGFEVAGCLSFGCTHSIEVGSVTPDKMIRMIQNIHAELAGCDALLVSCTGVRSTEIIEELEREAKMPVLTSNSAIIWAAMRFLNMPLTCVPKLGAFFHKQNTDIFN